MLDKKKESYTPREAAAALNVSVSTIQLWLKDGLLIHKTPKTDQSRIDSGSVEVMLGKKQMTSNTESDNTDFSIVVVEDNAQQRRLYDKQISSWGMNITLITAKDGYEGLIRIGSIFPDMIISDLMMPNMDGFEMIRALDGVSELENSTVIAATSLEHSDIKRKGGLPSSVEIFTKPISFEKLESLVREKRRAKAILADGVIR